MCIEASSIFRRLPDWREFVADVLLPICGKVAELVAPVVHSASPEGFLPPDLLLNLSKCRRMSSFALFNNLSCCRFRSARRTNVGANAQSNLSSATRQLLALTEGNVGHLRTAYSSAFSDCRRSESGTASFCLNMRYFSLFFLISSVTIITAFL